MDNITKKAMQDVIKMMKAKELRVFIERACIDYPEVFEDFKVFNHLEVLSINQYVIELEKIFNRNADDTEKVSVRKKILNEIESLLMPQLEIHFQEDKFEWMMDAIIITMPTIGRGALGKMEDHLIQIHEYLMYVHEKVLSNFNASERLSYMRRFLSIAQTCNDITETYILSHVKVLMDSIDSPDDLYHEMKDLLQNLPEGVSHRRTIAIIVVMIKLQDYIRVKDKGLNKLLSQFDDYEIVQDHLGILKLVE
ncbi:hypothetical protein [Macrococcoides canis]|uniref:Uncharacterized protein n=1 Tax=Macrococcoides canis TaxID=1855823 RepID=A0A6G7EW88_9STAP|nr:hypothetical protein [Macrococcus canis]MCO4097463.1 hypothetical protein [Macrococcus canis]QCT74154.1 hypothetical protein EST43_02420 [Macrococcus canis]QIH77612.1 hypothetical protein GTN30_02940 [Macrococcus canis]QNR07174.1 hypothetical protein GL258_02555 [Macrococcus canis]QTQ08607.1 hypothetical protein J9174_02715 [Macrococcus canis]